MNKIIITESTQSERDAMSEPSGKACPHCGHPMTMGELHMLEACLKCFYEQLDRRNPE